MLDIILELANFMQFCPVCLMQIVGSRLSPAIFIYFLFCIIWRMHAHVEIAFSSLVESSKYSGVQSGLNLNNSFVFGILYGFRAGLLVKLAAASLAFLLDGLTDANDGNPGTSSAAAAFNNMTLLLSLTGRVLGGAVVPFVTGGSPAKLDRVDRVDRVEGPPFPPGGLFLDNIFYILTQY
jgi:hypothetical protein